MKSQRMNLSKILAGTLAASMVVGVTPVTAYAMEENYKYIMMNVPYDVFYGSYMFLENEVGGASLNVALDTDTDSDSNYDAISTATTSKYKGTTGLARGTWNNGSVITGVTIPVRVSEAEYELLEANKGELTEASAYYYTDIIVNDENPAPTAYTDLDVESQRGTLEYDFTAMGVSSYALAASDYLAIKNLTTSSNYGDFQFDIEGYHTGKTSGAKGLQIAENTYLDTPIYGVILETEEGKQFAMSCLENIWVGTKVEYAEVAFSVPDGQQMKKGHGNGGLFCQLGDGLDGAKLARVTLITGEGVFPIDTSKQLDDYFAAPGLELLFDENVMTIKNYPAALQDKETYVTIAGLSEDNEVSFDVNGIGTAELDEIPVDGVSYSVVLMSEGAGPIKKTTATAMSNSQFKELSYWYAKGLKVVKENPDGDTMKLTDLNEHLAEAKEMLEKADEKDSVEASELIEELISKVKYFYETSFTASATLTGNIVAISLDGITLKKLVNPTYKITYTESGRGGQITKVLTSGTLSSLTQALAKTPTPGAMYRVVVVSDNYADVITEEIKAIGTPTVSIKAKTVTYTGSAIYVDAAVTNSDASPVITYYTNAACTKVISAPKNAGVYYVKATVAATDINKAATSTVVKLTINKAKPVVKASNVSKQLTASALKKKAQTIKVAASVTGNGKITYTKSSGSSVFTVNKSTGAIIVKKGTKKGTYKLTIKISAAASTNYVAATKTVTVTVKVK